MQSTTVGGNSFTLPKRYGLSASKVLGHGFVGTVISARDRQGEQAVSIKRITLIREVISDMKETLKHLKLTKTFSAHPNFLIFVDATVNKPQKEVYIIREMMDCSLDRIINSRQVLSEAHIVHFVKQLVEAVRALHSIGIVHCDIRAANVLVNQNCELRLGGFRYTYPADRPELFHSERYHSNRNKSNMAPELSLGQDQEDRRPSPPSDMFAVACLIAELYERMVLFAGSTVIDLTVLHVELMGYGTDEDLGFHMHPEARTYLNSRASPPRQTLRERLSNASAPAVDLLGALLLMNPTLRLTAEQALQHPYLAGADSGHDYSVAYLTRPPPDFLDFAAEGAELTAAQLWGLIEAELPSVALSQVQEAALDPLYYPLHYR